MTVAALQHALHIPHPAPFSRSMQLPSSAAVQSKSMLGRMDQRRRFGHICASASEAPSPTETASPEAARLDAAVTVSEWLKGTGGYVGPAQPVSTDAAAIGLRASGAIRRTEAVISVPQSKCRCATASSVHASILNATVTTGAFILFMRSAAAVSFHDSRPVRVFAQLLTADVAITAETALRSDLGKWISEFEPELADFRRV
eukprot:1803260-Pleurochrysis_carterae.AAC.1